MYPSYRARPETLETGMNCTHEPFRARPETLETGMNCTHEPFRVDVIRKLSQLENSTKEINNNEGRTSPAQYESLSNNDWAISTEDSPFEDTSRKEDSSQCTQKQLCCHIAFQIILPLAIAEVSKRINKESNYWKIFLPTFIAVFVLNIIISCLKANMSCSSAQEEASTALRVNTKNNYSTI
jgi:hypothetical protein